MSPEQSQAIQQAMQDASSKAEAEALAAFGPIAGDVCAALADLMNQMKFLVQVVDDGGNVMGSIAMAHAETSGVWTIASAVNCSMSL